MWNMIWPLLIVVGANTIYNISTKSTPSDVNAFASLATSYFIAMLGYRRISFVAWRRFLARIPQPHFACIAITRHSGNVVYCSIPAKWRRVLTTC